MQALQSIPRIAARNIPQRAARAALASHARFLATPATPPSPNDIFANGSNAYYAEEMYRRWKEDSSSVHASWDAYFSALDKGIPSSQAFQPPPFHMPEAAGGAPSLHIAGGNDLSDHLKVSILHHLRASLTSLLGYANKRAQGRPRPHDQNPSPATPLATCSIHVWGWINRLLLLRPLHTYHVLG